MVYNYISGILNFIISVLCSVLVLKYIFKCEFIYKSKIIGSIAIVYFFIYTFFSMKSTINILVINLIFQFIYFVCVINNKLHKKILMIFISMLLESFLQGFVEILSRADKISIFSLNHILIKIICFIIILCLSIIINKKKNILIL